MLFSYNLGISYCDLFITVKVPDVKAILAHPEIYFLLTTQITSVITVVCVHFKTAISKRCPIFKRLIILWPK